MFGYLIELCIVKKDDDWNLIASACDSVNRSDTGAKDAAKFIRKKLSRTQPPNVHHRTLTVLFYTEIFLNEINIKFYLFNG